MHVYSPFSNPLMDLTAIDLIDLRSAHEGWYVEYKREVPNASSIAKSISAFGNTYGGWLFYGIEEKSKEESVAGAFLGIERSDLDACLQRIRQAVATSVNPSPHFDIKVIWGPAIDIDLKADRAIIIINVPWSPTAPHIHKSGLIYRRVSDGSEPKAEADRFVLDQLFKRSNSIIKGYKKWIKNDPKFITGESGSYIRLFIVSDLWQNMGAKVNFEFETFASIMRSVDGPAVTISFDTVYESHACYVARQVGNNSPNKIGLFWKLYGDLACEVIIPLSFFTANHPIELRKWLHGYKYAIEYVRILEDKNYKNFTVIDLNVLFNLLIAISSKYRDLTKRAGWSGPLYFKAKLLDIARTIPFLDVKPLLDKFSLDGFPLHYTENVVTPLGFRPNDFTEIDVGREIENEQVIVTLQALDMFRQVASAFGFPGWISKDQAGADDYYHHNELQAAGLRAMEVQKMR